MRDKGRNRSWGIAGIFGILGWIVLWSLSDLSESRVQGQCLSAGQGRSVV
jgi:hypothetical protein